MTDTNLIIQYSVVGAILVTAVIWVIYKAIKNRKNKGKSNPCCGCSLSKSCGKKSL